MSNVKPRRKSRAKWYVIGVLVVLFVAVASWRSRGSAGADVTAVTVGQATTRTITQLVTATGKIQPRTEVKIAPEVSGEIVELPFREGAPVKRGDLLVRIKPDNYEFQLTQQEAGLAAAKAGAADSKARLERAEADFRRNEELHKASFLSDSDFAAARSAYLSAVAGYESSQASIVRSQGAVDQARDQLRKTSIFAPIDGRITVLNNEVGERVAGTGQFGGADLMRVADLDNMELRVRVNESDIVNVKIGNRVLITVDALPGRRVNGAVTQISNSAQGGTTAGMSTDDVTNFQVRIAVTDRGLELRPGMSATADIETQTVADVVAVPIQSVTVRDGTGLNSEELQKKGQEEAKEISGNELDPVAERERSRRDRDKLQRVVFLKAGDTVKMVPVETGIADLTHIEIKSGLKPGDEVVTGSYSAITRTLKDGSQVRIDTSRDEAKK